MAQPARKPSPAAESTRDAILRTAERLFAEKGFDRARLEDVAEAVGIRRASIVYYFKDKRILYDAVLESVFGSFRERLEATLAADGSLDDRIEAAISVWIDYVGARPTFVRILLREVADSASSDRPTLAPHIQPFAELVIRFMKRHAAAGDLRPTPIDPVHMASTIAGATVFFVAAMPALVPNIGFDPLSADHLEAHRAEVLKITRRLMGVPGEAPQPQRPGT